MSADPVAKLQLEHDSRRISVRFRSREGIDEILSQVQSSGAFYLRLEGEMPSTTEISVLFRTARRGEQFLATILAWGRGTVALQPQLRTKDFDKLTSSLRRALDRENNESGVHLRSLSDESVEIRDIAEQLQLPAESEEKPESTPEASAGEEREPSKKAASEPAAKMVRSPRSAKKTRKAQPKRSVAKESGPREHASDPPASEPPVPDPSPEAAPEATHQEPVDAAAQAKPARTTSTERPTAKAKKERRLATPTKPERPRATLEPPPALEVEPSSAPAIDRDVDPEIDPEDLPVSHDTPTRDLSKPIPRPLAQLDPPTGELEGKTGLGNDMFRRSGTDAGRPVPMRSPEARRGDFSPPSSGATTIEVPAPPPTPPPPPGSDAYRAVTKQPVPRIAKTTEVDAVGGAMSVAAMAPAFAFLDEPLVDPESLTGVCLSDGSAAIEALTSGPHYPGGTLLLAEDLEDDRRWWLVAEKGRIVNGYRTPLVPGSVLLSYVRSRMPVPESQVGWLVAYAQRNEISEESALLDFEWVDADELTDLVARRTEWVATDLARATNVEFRVGKLVVRPDRPDRRALSDRHALRKWLEQRRGSHGLDAFGFFDLDWMAGKDDVETAWARVRRDFDPARIAVLEGRNLGSIAEDVMAEARSHYAHIGEAAERAAYRRTIVSQDALERAIDMVETRWEMASEREDREEALKLGAQLEELRGTAPSPT